MHYFTLCLIVLSALFSTAAIPGGCGYNDNLAGGCFEPSPRAVLDSNAGPVAADTSDAVHLERVTLRDPHVNNLKSHTLLVPRGWTLEGGPLWTPQTFRSFVHLQLRMTAPDGRQVSVYPGMFYSHVEASFMPPLPVGTIDNGTIFMPVPSSIEEYVQRLFMPQHRPQAQNVRVLETAERPAMHRHLEETMQPLIQSARQGDRMQGTRTEFAIAAVRVRVAYEEGGRAWEEDLYITGSTQQTFSQEMALGSMVQSAWWMEDAVGLRAPAGSLDKERALLEPIRVSIRRTHKYASLIFELNMRLVRQQADALQRASQIWIENQNEILRTHGSKASSTQEKSDKAHHDYINSIHEVEDYQDTDGSTVSLPAFYDRVLTNKQGDYILTNDRFFNHMDWTEINRVR